MCIRDSVCFVILAEKLVEQEHFHFAVYYVAILFLAAYTGLIYLYKKRRRELAAFLALALVAVEAAVNTTVTSVTTTSRAAYTRDNKEDVYKRQSVPCLPVCSWRQKASTGPC